MILTGIYTITNIRNQKIYVGRAGDIKKRLKVHERMLKTNTHYNSYLQSAYNLEPTMFRFEVLEEYSKDLIIDMEQYWMNVTQAADKNFGYNIDPSAYTNTSGSFAQETKDKIRAYHTGRKQTPETIRKRVESIKKLPKREYHPCLGVLVVKETKNGVSTYPSIGNFLKSHSLTYREVKRIQATQEKVYLPDRDITLWVGENRRSNTKKRAK